MFVLVPERLKVSVRMKGVACRVSREAEIRRAKATTVRRNIGQLQESPTYYCLQIRHGAQAFPNQRRT